MLDVLRDFSPVGQALIATIGTYGGLKQDYSPSVDPTTDEDAVSINTVKCDVAMLTHTGLRAFCAFVTANTSTPTDPASNVHDAMWGNDVSVKPVVARTATGTFTVTWPTTVSDEGTEYGVTPSTHTLALRHAIATIESVTSHIARARVTAANVVTVEVLGTLFTGADTTSVQVCVYAY